MRFVLLAALSLVASASALVEVESLFGYHERVGIPTATKIKQREEEILARQSKNRIVGGEVAPPNAHPYVGGLVITFLSTSGTSACGSSLISPTRLVTAAHCWFDGQHQAFRFVVVLGSQYLFIGGQRIATSTVVSHPKWNPSTLQNDIAVIYLPVIVTLSENIQPIALPGRLLTESFTGEWSVAAGYGMIVDNQIGLPLLTMLRHVDVQVISFAQCEAVFGSWAQPSNICTSGAGGVGICLGDSGGPLFVTRGGQRILVGVSSFIAAAGCQAGLPSAFTRVTSFYDFIVAHL